MTRHHAGFTLIELMVVVAIIGILASIALPAFLQFVARSQVSEGLHLATPLKAAVAEYYWNHGTWPHNIVAVGITPPSGKYTRSVVVFAGVINITYEGQSGGNGHTANEIISGQVLSLQPAVTANGDMVWVCGHGAVPAGATAIGVNSTTFTGLSQYLPSTCRL